MENGCRSSPVWLSEADFPTQLQKPPSNTSFSLPSILRIKLRQSTSYWCAAFMLHKNYEYEGHWTLHRVLWIGNRNHTHPNDIVHIAPPTLENDSTLPYWPITKTSPDNIKEKKRASYACKEDPFFRRTVQETK